MPRVGVADLQHHHFGRPFALHVWDHCSGSVIGRNQQPDRRITALSGSALRSFRTTAILARMLFEVKASLMFQ